MNEEILRLEKGLLYITVFVSMNEESKRMEKALQDC